MLRSIWQRHRKGERAVLKLTNAETGEEGKPIALNPAFIEAIYVSFIMDEPDGEKCRVLCAGREWIVQETFEQIGLSPVWNK